MADEDDVVLCRVEYLDLPDNGVDETNWIKRAGKCRITYPNGHIFEGSYDSDRIKQGFGIYTWMGPTSDEDETLIEKAKYEGNYVNGQKSGIGKMTFPNGDIYEGEWADDKMNGEGTYIYKKTGDIYSGSWLNGKKHNDGRYEFQSDQSMFVGLWETGEFKTGSWEFKDSGVYEGDFKLGRPFGKGKFSFASGLIQSGEFVEKKVSEEEEEGEDDGVVKPPNVVWKGDSIVSI